MRHKHYANRGVERNKKPLKNIVYEIELAQLNDDIDKNKYKKYKFKELGYLTLVWHYEEKNPIKNWGVITPEELKQKIGVKQYAKFCQGKRKFIIQRRIDGKNTQISKKR